jgi:chromosome segregation ATPase
MTDEINFDKAKIEEARVRASMAAMVDVTTFGKALDDIDRLTARVAELEEGIEKYHKLIDEINPKLREVKERALSDMSQLAQLTEEAVALRVCKENLEILREQNAQLIEALKDMVAQHCNWDGKLDSGALSANSDAIGLLADLGIVEIEKDFGRMTVAHWTANLLDVLRRSRPRRGSSDRK